MRCYVVETKPWFSCWFLRFFFSSSELSSRWEWSNAGLYVSYLKGQGRRGIFSLVKAPYEEIVNFYWSIAWASSQWQGGMEAIAFVAYVKYQAC